jgi:hypothetical protein
MTASHNSPPRCLPFDFMRRCLPFDFMRFLALTRERGEEERRVLRAGRGGCVELRRPSISDKPKPKIPPAVVATASASAGPPVSIRDPGRIPVVVVLISSAGPISPVPSNKYPRGVRRAPQRLGRSYYFSLLTSLKNSKSAIKLLIITGGTGKCPNRQKPSFRV